MISSPSLTVGTRPLGFNFRYSGSRLPPKGPPTSSRSNGRSSSAQHPSTFCTFDDVERPQILSMAIPLIDAVSMEPELRRQRNRLRGPDAPRLLPSPAL